MTEQGLLPKIRASINRLSAQVQLSVAELEVEFWDTYNDPYLSDSGLSESMKQSTAFMTLQNSHVQSIPIETITFVAVGHSGIKFNTPTRDAFIIERGSPAIKRLVFRGDKLADIALNLKLGAVYKDFKVGKYSSGNDYFYMRNVKIPEDVRQGDVAKAIARAAIPRVNMKNIKSNLSRVRSDGYVDESDWRVIQGIVSSLFTGIQKKTGRPFGVMNVTDETVQDDVEVKEDGTMSIPTITCWTDPNLLTFGINSLCDFYGSVAVNDKGDINMNVYLVVPIAAAPAAEVPDTGGES